jgi:hypothetical protein
MGYSWGGKQVGADDADGLCGFVNDKVGCQGGFHVRVDGRAGGDVENDLSDIQRVLD